MSAVEYLWDREDANIPPYETGEIWLTVGSPPPTPFFKEGKLVMYHGGAMWQQWVNRIKEGSQQ